MRKNVLLWIFMCMQFSMYGQTKNFIDQPYIEVQGVAELEVTPNELYVSIRIKEQSKKGRKSIEDTEKQMFDKLKSIGVDIQKDVSLRDFASNFKYYWLKKSDILKQKEYQIVVRDMLVLGKIYTEMEKIGISNIKIYHVNHSEIQKFRRQVKVNAIKVAKEKAVQMVEAIGQRVTKAIYIRESVNHVSYKANASNIVIRAAKSSNGGFTPSETAIDFEQIRLKYSVTVRFAIE